MSKGIELKIKVGINFEFLQQNYDPKKKEKQGFCLEGSGGSGKTYDVLQFIIYYCEIHANKNKDILVTRESYAECKKTVLKDFIKILKSYGLYDQKCHRESHPQQYTYKGNTISFSGLDDSSAHGDRRDFIYFNELLLSDDDKAYKQLQGRCAELFIADWNPLYTIHWAYDQLLDRPDVKLFKSTFRTNPYLPLGERNEKLGYEPTPENIKNGTADEFMWRVYGLGERAAREGVIFKYVNWITEDEFPENEAYSMAMDFGYVNDPTVLVRVYVDEANKQIYAQELCYEPIDNPAAINDMLINISVPKFMPIIADSADKYISATTGAVEMVRDLKTYGWNISKVSKTQNLYFWILKMKEYKLNIVGTINLKREFENYMWRTINGQAVNQPIDKFNHGIDAIRYGLMGANSNKNSGAFWN